MIKLTDLSKQYAIKKGEFVQALDRINLTLPDRGLVFITGKSGSGKTTLLNILGGLDSATSGLMEVNGKDIKEYSGKNYDDYRNYMVGFVFQDYNLINDYNVKQNIALALELQKDKDKDAKIDSALKRVGLEGYENRNVKQLSGGQKQRVAIARALVKKSKIILADEPTGNLDSVTSEEIYDLLKEISEDALVVVVSHDIENAEKYADRLIKMKDGGIYKDDKRSEKVNDEDIRNNEKSEENESGNISFFNIFKMGLRNLWKHKFKLFVTAILFFVTLSIIGSGVAIFSKNPYERYRETYLKVGVNSFVVKLVNDDSSQKVSVEDHEKFGSSFSHKSLINYDYTIGINGMEQSKVPQYYSSEITGITVIDDLAKQSDFQMYCGKMPRDGHNEICISLYTAQSILEREYAFCQANNINKLEDILNKEVNFKNNRGIFIISGIVDTNVSKRFDSLKTANSEEWEKNYLDPNTMIGLFISQHIKDGLHRNIIVTKYFIDHFYSGRGDYRGEFQQHLVPKDDSYSYEPSVYIFYPNIISVNLYDTTDAFGEQITEADDIIVNEKIFTSYMNEDSVVRELGDDGYYYIKLTVYDDHNKSKRIEKKFRIKGYTVGERKPCVVSENVFDQIVDRKMYANSMQIYLMDKKNDRKLFESISQNRSVRIYDEIYDQVMGVNDAIDIVLTFGVYILIGVAIFTILMMLNFIVTTINGTKHEIGILRALGTKQSNVFAIYFIEMFILSIIVWVISIFGAIGISYCCSKVIARGAPLISQNSIMPIGIISILAMLLFSVFIAFIGSVIPIITKTKKKPVELLR